MPWIIKSFIFITIFFAACVPPSKEVNSEVKIDIKDTRVQKIIDFQDQGIIDSLIPLFSSEDANDRYLGARALASIKDNSVHPFLVSLLDDDNMKIRSIAAYALGQIGEEANTESLIEAFIDQDTLDVDNTLNAQLLEALGKISNEAIMNNIASVESYRADDTLLLLGQTRSLYRFGLNGFKSQETTNAALKYALDNQYPEEVRLMAASYLGRNNGLDISLRQGELFRQIRREEDPNIRMNLALAIRNLSNESDLIPEILNMYNAEKDYRVKVYFIKALSQFPYIQVVEPIMKMVEDPNIHVSITAAQYLSDKGNRSDAYLYRELVKDDMPWQIKSKIYESVLKNVPVYYTKIKNSLGNQIEEEYQESENIYEQAGLIRALSFDPYQFQRLIELNTEAKDPVIKTAIAEGFHRQISSPDFIKAFGGRYIRTARTMVDTMIVDAKRGDLGAIYYLSQVLKLDTYDWNSMIKDSTWQEDVLNTMKLPQDIESYNEFNEALSKINNESFTKVTPEFNHPIDWTLLQTVYDSSRVVMKTSKGNITLKLFPDHAPGSVANFLGLCQSDFYDGKVFHRVVPNFVIQGGCPIGDGFGALDYTIRSELGPKYYDDEGYIGMASAGNHTEGVQFFITHSPTPHLDGRYTIFGKVTKGMDVVHDIQVGDKIIDAILTYE